MITYLKNIEGSKHKDLKSKDFDSIKELFEKAFTRVNMFVDFRTELVEGSSKRAGEELETTTKSPSIIDWKIDKEGKKSYYQIVRADGKCQMYRKNIKFRGGLLGLKSLLNATSITAALIDVNAAQSKLRGVWNWVCKVLKCEWFSMSKDMAIQCGLVPEPFSLLVDLNIKSTKCELAEDILASLVEESSASALQVLRRASSIFTSVYVVVKKLKKILTRALV
ncbi:hypothetical protein Tco_0845366 [Tanacetum coccineum]